MVTQQIFLFSLFPARRPLLTCPQKSAENAAEKQRFDPENNDSKQRFAAETTIQNNDSTKNNVSQKIETLFLGKLTPVISRNNVSIKQRFEKQRFAAETTIRFGPIRGGQIAQKQRFTENRIVVFGRIVVLNRCFQGRIVVFLRRFLRISADMSKVAGSPKKVKIKKSVA